MSERSTFFMVNNKNTTSLLVAVLFFAFFSIGATQLPPTTPPSALPVAAVDDAAMDNLALSVTLAGDVFVAPQGIVWHIRAVDSSYERRYLGYAPSFSVPSGQYEVSVSIGAYTAVQTVEVLAGQRSKLAFTATVGRLRVRSSHPADWSVVAQSGEDAGKTVLTNTNSSTLDTLLPPGEYDVLAHRGDGIQKVQRLRVTAGKLSAASIQMPSGKVTLIATLANGPAMRPVSWSVYRLDEGKQTIASLRRHSANLEVAPGHYEAVAALDGQERRRAFTVMGGGSNRVVIAMD